MENALVLRNQVTPDTWNLITQMAPVIHQSRLFGVSSTEQAAAIMLKGHEVGFGFAASFDMIQVIQGKPAVSPRGALALVYQQSDLESIKFNRLIEKGAFLGYEVTMTRKGKITYTSKFTLEDAKRAGLIKSGSGWETYPENMCLWRATGFVCDVVYPDITAGLTGLMKMPEAYGVALSEGGDIIDLKAEDYKTLPVQNDVPVPEITLNDLMAKYTPAQIMEANNGKIPGTADEVKLAFEKLGAL